MQFRPRCNINEWIMFPSTDFQYLMNAYWMCYTNVVENHCCWQGIWKDAREIRKTFNLNLNWEVWNGYFSYSNSPGCKFRYITYLMLICFYKTWLRPEIWKINYLNHRITGNASFSSKVSEWQYKKVLLNWRDFPALFARLKKTHLYFSLCKS